MREGRSSSAASTDRHETDSWLFLNKHSSRDSCESGSLLEITQRVSETVTYVIDDI